MAGQQGALVDPPQTRRKRRTLRSRVPRGQHLAVLGGTLLLIAMGLGFLISTPTLNGPDEQWQFDRVVAAAHGDLLPEPGVLHRSRGVDGAVRTFLKSSMVRSGPSWASFEAVPRPRPSLDDLGGNVRPTTATTNYMTQHPPLYFAVAGAVMWLLPDADGMPVDQLVWLLRLFNLLLIAPLPFLFAATARRISDHPHVAAAAAFLPCLLPGLPRIAATINNENLGILLGAVLILGAVRVVRGDTGVRTGLALSAMMVLASITKITILAVALCVPVAYVVRWILDRRAPSPRVMAAVVGGGALAGVWWVRNYLTYGALTPAAQSWGRNYTSITGTPRPPGSVVDYDRFWSQMLLQVPLRVWGSLGLLEPPTLPTVVQWVLTVGVFAAAAMAVILSSGRRSAVGLPFVLALTVIGLMVYNTLAWYRIHPVITGIQGRYVFATASGLLIPVAIALVALLRRHGRWAPLVVFVLATGISGWGWWLSVEYTWLVRGSRLGIGNAGVALVHLRAHFPFGGVLLSTLIAIAVATFVAAAAAAVGYGLQSRSETTADPLPTGRQEPAEVPV